MSEGRPESIGARTFRPAPTPVAPVDEPRPADDRTGDPTDGFGGQHDLRRPPSESARPADRQASDHPAGRQGSDHRSGSLGPAIVHATMPFTGPVGPLIGFLVLREKPGPDRASVVEALNFSIGYTAAVIVSAILTTVLIGAVILPLVLLAALVLGLAGAIETYRGGTYRYPVNLRLIR